MNEMHTVLERIDCLEALDEITQLPAKYALSIDMRDFDAMANLFVDDVGVSGRLKGRAPLKELYDRAMRRGDILGSAHGVHGHNIDMSRKT